MDHLLHLLVFSAQVILIVVAIAVILAVFFYFIAQGRRANKTVEIEHLNEHMEAMCETLNHHMLSKKELKALAKEEKAKHKEADDAPKPRVFVIDFEGDIHARAVESLREEVTAILAVARPTDQVVCRLESPGGVVNGYGLAAAQLMRVREHGVRLVVTVDKVAASGGYMMACVANHIVAAPFAIVGSIGVVAQIPNFNRLLRKHQIDYREYMAGDYKRTVSLFGENTPQGVAKFNEQLQDTHVLFKDFIHQHRPNLDVAKVATGEHWYGLQALGLGLVDEIKTSDGHLASLLKTAEIYKVRYFVKRKLSERLAEVTGQVMARTWEKFISETSPLV